MSHFAWFKSFLLQPLNLRWSPKLSCLNMKSWSQPVGPGELGFWRKNHPGTLVGHVEPTLGQGLNGSMKSLALQEGNVGWTFGCCQNNSSATMCWGWFGFGVIEALSETLCVCLCAMAKRKKRWEGSLENNTHPIPGNCGMRPDPTRRGWGWWRW